MGRELYLLSELLDAIKSDYDWETKYKCWLAEIKEAEELVTDMKS